MKKKRSGDAELIVSIFVIASLSIVLLLFVSLIGDLNVRMDLNQQVRKCALQAESADLSTKAKIDEFAGKAQESIKESLHTEGVEDVKVEIGKSTSKNGDTVSVQPTNGIKYGDSIVVLVKFTVKITEYNETSGGFGKMTKVAKPDTYVIQKATTCKRLE